MALNRCEFIGNLGRDPEIRHTQDGRKIASLSIGVTEKWKSNGEQKERTEWVRCNVFGNRDSDGLAGVVERFLKKGSKVYIAGKLTTRKWQDQSGQDKYSTEVNVNELEMLDGKPAGERQQSGGGWEPPADLDDEIPF